MSGRTGKKTNVVFAKPEEPSFLKKFKEKAGYKESSGVSDKFQVMPKATEEDLEDGGDELPQVVQLNPEDVSQEEYKDYLEKDKKNKENKKKEDISEGGKILFRQLVGKRHHEKNELKASTKKQKTLLSEDKKEKEKDKKEKEKDKKKEKSNKKLLSFDDEDDSDGTT